MPESANIARHLPLMAARQPDRPALKIPRGRTAAGEIDYLSLSFAELDAEVNAWCARLTAAGLRRGDRTLVMVKQGLPLIASVFALFKLGAVPIVIDPGMGLKNFLRCVRRSQPRALLGIPLAQFIGRIFRPTFRSVQVRVTASSSLTARQSNPIGCFPVAEVGADELAAILFTSGSTGAPKGVCYEHGMFEAQVRLIREHYGIQPGEVDLPMLPIFALFNPALGMTTIVPETDPRRPAAVDPAKIVQAIRQENVTNSFGSPTLWQKIQRHCLETGATLPTLRRVLCAGAPVPAALWENPARWLPQGTLHSPYGATEALPIGSISHREIEQITHRQTPNQQPTASATAPALSFGTLAFGLSAPAGAGAGACVGQPLPGMTVRVIRLDTPKGELIETAPGEIGEIIVSGPVVTKIYDAMPEATAVAKITDGDRLWHRMGDCGWMDETGRLWFCGRMVESVVTAAGRLFTEPCEQVFRVHPGAQRCALIGLGTGAVRQPALVVETSVKDSREARTLVRELRQLALAHPHTAAIKVFYFRARLPVDVRHNAKIHRLTLAAWAATAKGYESDPKR